MTKANVAIAGWIAAGCLFAQGPGAGPRPMMGGMGGPAGRGMGVMGGMMRIEATVTGAPFSAVRVAQVQESLQGGNQIQRTEETKIWRDSQGRVREEHTSNAPAAMNQRPRNLIVITDPVAGFVYALD